MERMEIWSGHSSTAKNSGRTGVIDNGFRLLTNCSEGAGQTVFHYHLIGVLN